MKEWKIGVLLVICVAMGAGAYSLGYFILWYLTGCLLMMLTLAGWTFFYALEGYRFRRIAHVPSLHEHGLMKITLRIERTGIILVPIPWLVIKESWVHHQTKRAFHFQWFFMPWWKRQIQLDYDFVQLARGQYNVQAMTLRSGDGFGIVEKVKLLQDEVQFIVPPFHYDRDIGLVRRLLQVDCNASTSYVENGQIEGIHEYQCGESLSRIDWKSSLRHGKWLSKQYERESALRVLVLIDECLDQDCVVNHGLHENGERFASVTDLYPLYERRVSLSKVIFEQLKLARYCVTWASNFNYNGLGPASYHHQEFNTHLFSELCGNFDESGHHYAQFIRAEFVQSSWPLMMICVTSSVTNFLLAALAEVRSKKQSVLVYFVHEPVSLSTKEREAIVKLQAMGCNLIDVPHERSVWPVACTVLETTRGHATPLRLHMTQAQWLGEATPISPLVALHRGGATVAQRCTS